MTMTDAGLGRNGNVTVSSPRQYAKTGYCPQSSIVLLLSALSCDVVTNETYNQSEKLDGNRGPGEEVGTMVERAGAVPFEFIPGGYGWEYLLRAGLYYWNEGTDKTPGGGNSDLDGAVSKGDVSITLTDASDYASGDYIQIDTGTHTTEVCKIDSVTGTPTLTLIDPLNFDHADATTCNEVIAPFTHNFKFNNAAHLESLTIDKYLGDLFGERFDGSFINTMSMTGAVDGLITGNVDVIAAEVKKILADAATADSGTTSATTAGKLTDGAQSFETTIKKGYLVKNTIDNTYAYVTKVDSDTALSLDNDIMATGETYTIYTNPYFLSSSAIEALKPTIKENYIFAKSTITIDGASPAGDVVDATFTVNNNLSAGKAKGSGDNLSRVTTQRGEITYDFNIVYTDSTFYDAYRDGDTFAIIDTFEHDSVISGSNTYEMKLTIPKAKIKTAPVPLTPEELSLAVSCTCQYDSVTESHFILSIKDNTYQYPYEI